MAKGVKRSIYLYINGEEVENNIKAITAKMTKLINEQKKMTLGSDEYIAHASKIKQLKNVVDEHNASLRTTASSWDRLKSTFGNMGAMISGAMLGMQGLNQVIGSLKKMATDVAAMDDIYSNVMKYTGMTRDEVAALNEEFKQLDTRTSREELNRLAGEAGKLGIEGKNKIMEFVDAANIINVSLGEDLGEDAVKNIGKMAEMFGETDRLGLRGAMLATGSAINFLGQNSSAAEPYLMEFTARLSGTANQAKMTQAQILGYASVLDQNMQQVEMSATAMQNLIMKMMQNPAKFAKMAGIEVGKFANMLESDANGALLTFIETLNKKGGLTQLAPMFKEMGLDGVRASGVISVLAKDIDKVREEQEKANKAYQEGTSVTDEYGIKNNTLQAQLEKAKKKFQDMKLELGEKLYPVLLGLTKTSTAFIKIISSISSFISENKGLVIALASAWVAYLAIMVKGKVATLAMGVATKANTVLMGLQKVAVLASSVAYNTMTGNATRAAAAQKLLKASMVGMPWGAILAGVTAIGIGIYKMATRMTEAEKATLQFNKEAAKEEAQASYLFMKLSKLENGTKEYKDTLNKLKELYPEIIRAHLTEKGTLDSLAQAYKDVVKNIQSKIAIQLKEAETTKAIEDQINNTNETYAKIRKSLLKQNITGVKQDDIIQQIKQEIAAGKDAATVWSNIQKEFDLKDSASGFKGFSQTISQYLLYLEKADILTQKRVENITKDFSQFIELTESEKIIKQIAELEKALPAAESKNEKESIRKEIEALRKRLAELKNEVKKEDDKNKNSGKYSADDDYEKRYKAYLERLKDFRRQHLFDEQSDFIKEIATTKAAYDEMIEEAKKFNDKKNMLALDDEKTKAIEAIVIKHAKDLNKKINELSAKSSDNQLLDAIAGQAKKYNDVIDETDRLIASLTELNEIEKDPEIVKTIDDLWTKRKNLVSERNQEINDIINKYTKEISDSVLNEHDKQIKSINDRYDKEIETIKAAIEEKKKLGETEDSSEIKRLTELLAKINKARDKELKKNELSIKGKLANILGIEESDLDAILQEAQNFYTTLSDSLLTISENRNKKELADFENSQEAKRNALQAQLDSGALSQEEYNKQIAKLDSDLTNKQNELNKEQFEKEKAASLASAIINAAVSITDIWTKYGDLPYIAGILTAISAAATGVQIATIASEANPYAAGGYINEEQIIRAGEKGREWVASNKLLNNPITAPVIQALDNYQKGKSNTYNALGFSTPTVSENSGSSYFSTKTKTSDAAKSGDVWQKDMQDLAKYMKDPNNRQATVNRVLLSKFDNQESTLKNTTILS